MCNWGRYILFVLHQFLIQSEKFTFWENDKKYFRCKILHNFVDVQVTLSLFSQPRESENWNLFHEVKQLDFTLKRLTKVRAALVGIKDLRFTARTVAVAAVRLAYLDINLVANMA